MDHVNETQYSIGYKIQLKCREGYMLYGSSVIFCTSDGEWTKVMARCSSKFKSFWLLPLCGPTILIHKKFQKFLATDRIYPAMQ